MSIREKVIITDETILKDLACEGNDEWIHIEEAQTYFDTEKGSADFEVILQRVEDKKYFKLKLTKWPSVSIQSYNYTLTEVFPIEKTITIYK